MALTSKDGLWDRNFQAYEQEELDEDTELEDKIEIKWADLSCLKRKQNCTLIVGNDKSCHIFNALLKDKYYKLATISYANYKVSVKNSQRGIAQNVIIYSNKNPKESETNKYGQFGSAAMTAIAQTVQMKDESSKKAEIIFIYAPNVPSQYHYCLSQFVLLHFRPAKVVCLDILSRGNYAQNYDEMEMPQIRKICTANTNGFEEKKQWMPFVDEIKELETANWISSLAAAVLQQCEYNGSEGHLFVAVSDLDYLTEVLIVFGNVLIDFVPSFAELFGTNKIKELRAIVMKKCAKYANKKGHLLTGRAMFC